MTASAAGDAVMSGKNVRQKAGLNREILDTSPGMLMGMLRYKAERAGGRFVAVEARKTSQECSGCGAQVQKDLSDRIHKCSHCKTDLHRDVNAARNILKRAVAGPWSGFAQQLPNGLTGDRRFGNLTTKFAAWRRIQAETLPGARPTSGSRNGLPQVKQDLKDLRDGEVNAVATVAGRQR